MLFVFWLSTPFTAMVVFFIIIMEPSIAPARWWPFWCLKCSSGLRRQDKIWVFWVSYNCSTSCSNIVRRQIRWVGYTPLLLHCVGEKSCIVTWNKCFSSLSQVSGWSFLVLHFQWNVCNWIPKPIRPRKDWFGSFLLEDASFHCRHIYMN